MLSELCQYVILGHLSGGSRRAFEKDVAIHRKVRALAPS
jgi:hypothetical protein